MTLSGGKVALSFWSYEGASYDPALYTGALGYSNGKVTFAWAGPLTIDYAFARDDGSDFTTYGDVEKAGDADLWLAPAPPDFRTYIQDYWAKGNARSQPYCDYPYQVTVDRYSSQGFASGGEGACGGNADIWAKTAHGWTLLLGYQDGPFCWELPKQPTLAKALHALGLSCMTRSGGVVKQGSWPELGR